MEWKFAPILARLRAKVEPHRADLPPHWLRCEWCNKEGKRCRKGDGHEGEHELPKEKIA